MSSLDERLQWLWQRQEEFQRLVRHKAGLRASAPRELDDYDKMEFIREQTLALIAELVEMLGETGWKSWASSNHLNRDKYLGEVVDALHFLVNLCLVAGITLEELVQGYEEKLHRNFLRQEEGYDGLRNKCPGCKRELDERGRISVIREHPASSFHCSQCGAQLDPRLIDQQWLAVAR